MTYLQQATTTIADAHKLTVSIWFRVPAVGGVPGGGSQQNLFNFGLNGVDDLLKVSRIYFISLNNTWQFAFFGFGGGPNPNPLPPPDFFGMFNSWISNTIPASYDAWHNLIIAYDGSAGIVGDGFHALSSAPVFKVMLDRVELVGTASASNPEFSIFDTNRGSNGMYVQGFPVGLPLTTEQEQFPLEFTYEIMFDNTQIWFDKYIDLTVAANLDTFVLIDGSGNPILPPDIRAAQDAFGTSDIWFNRDSISDIKFEENQGTGGPFTVVGTAPIDFQPLPGEP